MLGRNVCVVSPCFWDTREGTRAPYFLCGNLWVRVVVFVCLLLVFFFKFIQVSKLTRRQRNKIQVKLKCALDKGIFLENWCRVFRSGTTSCHWFQGGEHDKFVLEQFYNELFILPLLLSSYLDILKLYTEFPYLNILLNHNDNFKLNP